MHPLDGPRLKVRRAESEIQALKLAEESFRREADYRIVPTKLNPKTLRMIYRVRINSPPPSLDWGVDIGEIAHNLRSALDGLVFQVATLQVKEPARNCQFPIFLVGHTTKRTQGKRKELIPHFEGFRRSDGRSMIRSLKPKHQLTIENLQPYKRGRGGRNSPLFWLKEINNADKHRLIQVVGAKPGIWPININQRNFEEPGRIRPGMILKDGAIFDEGAPGLYMTRIIPLLAFWDGCPTVKGKAVVNTLRIITENVSQVVEEFASEFD